MAEVVLCAKVDGIELESSIIDLKIDQTKRMAPYKTSMLLDYENQRPIEIQAILGNVLAFASTHQLPLPTIQALYDELYLKITKEKLC